MNSAASPKFAKILLEWSKDHGIQVSLPVIPLTKMLVEYYQDAMTMPKKHAIEKTYSLSEDEKDVLQKNIRTLIEAETKDDIVDTKDEKEEKEIEETADETASADDVVQKAKNVDADYELIIHADYIRNLDRTDLVKKSKLSDDTKQAFAKIVLAIPEYAEKVALDKAQTETFIRAMLPVCQVVTMSPDVQERVAKIMEKIEIDPERPGYTTDVQVFENKKISEQVANDRKRAFKRSLAENNGLDTDEFENKNIFALAMTYGPGISERTNPQAITILSKIYDGYTGSQEDLANRNTKALALAPLLFSDMKDFDAFLVTIMAADEVIQNQNETDSNQLLNVPAETVELADEIMDLGEATRICLLSGDSVLITESDSKKIRNYVEFLYDKPSKLASVLESLTGSTDGYGYVYNLAWQHFTRTKS